ncbi:MAG: hypothetical protein V4543_14835, partial [Bacteroidota bacterium]
LTLKCVKQPPRNVGLFALGGISIILNYDSTMSTLGSERRRKLFNRYACNLNLLISQGVLKGIVKQFEDTYICPICLDQFSIESLRQDSINPLTLEDVPPKSLGGKANILTCRRCNNSCGHHIDVHLTCRMEELDNSKFIPGTSFNANVEHNGILVQAKIIVDQYGKIEVRHAEKDNNPDRLTSFIDNIAPNDIINLIYRNKRTDLHKMQLALLKIAFLLTFEKYGYAFILDSVYNDIRRQLLNPESPIYPVSFWFQQKFPKHMWGVPFVVEPQRESILPIFALSTNCSTRIFAALIPLPIAQSLGEVSNLPNRVRELSRSGIKIDPMGPNTDYLTNLDAINKMMTWIDELRNKKCGANN